MQIILMTELNKIVWIVKQERIKIFAIIILIYFL